MNITSSYLRTVDLVRKVPFQAVYGEAIHNQTLPSAELADLQLLNLNRTLEHAVANSLFYSQSIPPNLTELKSLSQLRNLPLLDKQTLRVSVEHVRTGAPFGREFSARTSGSTGASLEFYVDSLQTAWSEVAQWRGRSWWGLTRGVRQVVLWGRPSGEGRLASSLGKAKYLARNYRQFNTFRQMDDDYCYEIFATIRRWKPRIIYGYGSSIARLAAFMKENGLRLNWDERPGIVEFTADEMSDYEKLLAGNVFDAPVLTAYGASETPGIAQQCPSGSLHISADACIVEVLDADGEPVGYGQEGEAVVTTFKNNAMPLIRYRVGDRLTLRDERCDCGVGLPLMDFGVGKLAPLISTSWRSNVSAHVLDYINIELIRSGLVGIDQFFVRQTHPDVFELEFVRRDPFNPESLQLFERRMREAFGTDITIRSSEVQEIPLPESGKRRYFLSLVEDNRE